MGFEIAAMLQVKDCFFRSEKFGLVIMYYRSYNALQNEANYVNNKSKRL